jgi:hypothetical protein
MEEVLVNRVAASGLITINLEDFYPEGEIIAFDLKPFLFMELILKEKDFREAMKAHDWTQYGGKNIAVFCSNDAIIPVWAYMLVAIHASPYANEVFQGTIDEFLKVHYEQAVKNVNVEEYANERIVIKGCSNRPVPASAYLALTKRLRPVALSIMYGEPCSTVPIYKKPK